MAPHYEVLVDASWNKKMRNEMVSILDWDERRKER